MMRSISARCFTLFSLVLVFLLVMDQGQNLRAMGGNPPNATVGYGCTRSSPNGARYSGTDCTITGIWQASTGDKLTKVELWVGDVRRYVQEWPSGTGPTSWGLISRSFSSTQFAFDSTITLRAKCWDDGYGVYGDEDTCDKICWNRGYILYNTDLDWGDNKAGSANNVMADMNHGTSGVISTHNKNNILANIPNYGLFYMNTHGASSWQFWDCPNANVISDGEVNTAVNTKTSGQCPYTFVFLDGCETGETGTYEASFECASFLGWDGLSYDSETYYNWTKKVWDELALYLTISGACAVANDAYPGLTPSRIWGDSLLRVHFVWGSL